MLELLLTSGGMDVPFVPPAAVPGTPYKGYVTASNLVRGDSLATLVGLTDGTAINPDGGWLHYIDGEKEFYIARLPIRYGMSGASLAAANQKVGTTITINGLDYRVRMMTGMAVNPFSSIVSDASGGEWNQYIYPIYGGGDRPAGAQWSYYLNSDLGLQNSSVANGSISLCADVHSTISNGFAGRGRDYSGGTSGAAITRKTVINDGNTGEGNGGFGRNAYGWRPILDLLTPPAVIDTWENIGTMSVQRSRLTATVISGLVYLYGGYNESSVIQGTLHSFDPVTKTFAALTTGPVRGFHDAIGINGKLYSFGGFDSSGTTCTSSVHVYDPATNAWTVPVVQGASLVARAQHKLIRDGNGFLIIGGITTGGAAVTDVYRYDTITQQASLVTGTYNSAQFGIADNESGVAYLSGGNPSAPSASFNAFTMSGGTQQARAAMPSTRYAHTSFYAKGGVYVMGGTAGTPVDATKTQRFVPGTNTWVAMATIPYTMTDYTVSVKVGAAVYLFGGTGANGNTCWKYQP